MQRTVSDLLAKKERYCMTQYLPEQPARQVPEVTRPQSLDRVALGELAKDSVYTVAQFAQEGTSTRVGIFGLAGVGSHKFEISLSQFPRSLGRMVVAIPNDDAAGTLNEIREHPQFMDLSLIHI